MEKLHRRSLLGLAGLGALGALARPMLSAIAAPSKISGEDEFFVFVHANGGWDVTLWADPRNEHKGIVDPASTANTDTGLVRLWKDVALDGDARSF
jgi:hypothetical protein